MAEKDSELATSPDVDGSNVYSHIDFERSRLMANLSLAASVRIPWQEVDTIRTLFGYEFQDFHTRDEHCRIFYNDKDIVVSFQSSNEDNPEHWKRNLNFGRWHPFTMGAITQLPAPFNDDSKLHPGFAAALEKQSMVPTGTPKPLHALVSDVCRQLVADNPRAIHFTGHSAGAALSVIQASYMAAENEAAEAEGKNKPFDLGEIYTFGAPRVGNNNFRDHMRQHFDNKYFRFELPNDPVPAWPRAEDQVYVHGGQLIALTKDGKTLDLKSTLKPGADSFSHVGLWAGDKLSAGTYVAGSAVQTGLKWITQRFVSPAPGQIDNATGKGQWPNIEDYHYIENYMEALDAYMAREQKGEETDISQEAFAELEGEVVLNPRKHHQPTTIVPGIEVTRYRIGEGRQFNRIVRWFNIAEKQLRQKIDEYDGPNKDSLAERLDTFAAGIQSTLRAAGNETDEESAGRPKNWVSLQPKGWFEDCLDKLQSLTNEIHRIPNMDEHENFMLDRVLVEMRRFKEQVSKQDQIAL